MQPVSPLLSKKIENIYDGLEKSDAEQMSMSTALGNIPRPAGRPAMTWLVVAFSGCALLVLSSGLIGRSLWLDESMLLRNFFPAPGYDFFKPLGLYDQAAPPVVALMLALFGNLWGADIAVLRTALLAIVISSLAYCLIQASRTFGLLTASAMAVLSIANYEFVYFSTEVKHYAFELAGVHLLLGWLYGYFRSPRKHLQWQDCVALSSGLILGFSTLFVFAGAVAVAAAHQLPANRRNSTGLACIAGLLLVAALYKYAISYYSAFQIDNNFVYVQSPGLDGLARVFDVVRDAFGTAALGAALAGTYLLSATLAGARVQANDCRASYFAFLFLVIGALVAATVAGLYPAYTTRQLVWILPLLTATTAIALTAPVRRERWLLIPMILALAIQAYALPTQVAKLVQYRDSTDNNALYEALARQQDSLVLTSLLAQPTLEIYKARIPALAKHQYVGVVNNRSGHLLEKEAYLREFSKRIVDSAGAWGSTAYFSEQNQFEIYADWAMDQTADHDSFLLLHSHDYKPLDDALRASLESRGCRMTQIFAGANTALWRASCGE